jgi:hypothetical protein
MQQVVAAEKEKVTAQFITAVASRVPLLTSSGINSMDMALRRSSQIDRPEASPKLPTSIGSTCTLAVRKTHE